MFKILSSRHKQGHRTIRFPSKDIRMPEHFRGKLLIDRGRCPSDCHDCEKVCPTHALSRTNGALSVDLGRCLFCTDCREACPQSAISHDRNYALSTRTRENLQLNSDELILAEKLKAESLRIFGRSLKLRQVSAGGCNACEADINVLSTLVFDLERFGIQVVASPRHADALIITGPVTKNMKLALEKTYEATPDPKLVIAVGACAISGGPFIDHAEANNGIGDMFKVDLYIPGCPPHPLTILDGLLRLLGKIK